MDISNRIEPGTEPLCPLCDQPIIGETEAQMVVAHDAWFAICGDCFDDEASARNEEGVLRHD